MGPTTVNGQYVLQRIRNSIEIAKQLRCLNFLITETFENALQQAEALLHEQPQYLERRCLAGWPVVVKDCFSTAGLRTTCASRMLANYVPPFNATAVQLLEEAGAIILGKSNMDEFSMGASSTEGYFGPVKNPWYLKQLVDQGLTKDEIVKAMESDFLIAGGSSGGSAVAVACDVAKIALGSDTGGSTRNPAAFCGIVGLKPTYGLISRHGLIPLVNSLDVVGLLAKHVTDVAEALVVLAKPDILDSTSVVFPFSSSGLFENFSVKGLKIGIPKEYSVSNLASSTLAAWKNVTALLKDSGAEIIEVSLPHTKYSIMCYHVIGESEISSNMAKFDGIRYGFRGEDECSLNALIAESRQKGFNEVVKRRIVAGTYFLLRENYEQYFIKAQKIRRLIAEDFAKVFHKQRIDFLLTPATFSDAPLFSEYYADDQGYERERKDDFFTQPVNMAGIPAIVLPVCLSARQLPIGIQLIADEFQDMKLLNLALWLEKRLAFPYLGIESVLNRMASAENTVSASQRENSVL